MKESEERSAGTASEEGSGDAQERDVRKATRAMDKQADELEERSDSLEHDISSTRQDYERKRDDGNTAGFPHPESDDDDDEGTVAG